MLIKLRTKWGRLEIDGDKIHSMHLAVYPWNDYFKITFSMEDGSQLEAELDDVNELMKIIRHIRFIRQYKYIDDSGYSIIDEPRRLSLMDEFGSEDD